MRDAAGVSFGYQAPLVEWKALLLLAFMQKLILQNVPEMEHADTSHTLPNTMGH